MPLADSITPPMKELKGNWIEPKLAGILGDSERAIKMYLEANLGAAMEKTTSPEKIGEAVRMLQPFLRDAITDAITHRPDHGIRIDESVRPPALALSLSGKDQLESTVVGIDSAAQPVIRKALKAGLQAAFKGIREAKAEILGTTEAVYQR